MYKQASYSLSRVRARASLVESSHARLQVATLVSLRDWEWSTTCRVRVESWVRSGCDAAERGTSKAYARKACYHTRGMCADCASLNFGSGMEVRADVSGLS